MVKHEQQKCKEFAISEEALDELIDNTSKDSYKAMLILLSFGMRAGEAAHTRKHWIHVNDKSAIQEGADYIEIPPKSDLCSCADCLLRGYIEKQQGSRKNRKEHNAEWYYEKQREFFKLHRKPSKKNPERDYRLKYKIYWSPKSDLGKRKIWILNKERANFVKEYFEENDSIGLQRRSIWAVVKKIGKKVFGKDSPKLFPHAIRSSTATILAGKGISSMSLQHQMGWSTIAMADSYVKPQEKMALMDLKSKQKEK